MLSRTADEKAIQATNTHVTNVNKHTKRRTVYQRRMLEILTGAHCTWTKSLPNTSLKSSMFTMRSSSASSRDVLTVSDPNWMLICEMEERNFA